MAMSKDDVRMLLAEINEAEACDHEMVEDLLDVIASERRQPTPAEMRFLRKSTAWTEQQVASQLGRVGRKVKLLAIAGTKADREAAEKVASEDAAILESEEVKIQTAIDELVSKLDGLRRNAKLSSQRVLEHQKACEDLQKCIPDHVQEEIDKHIRDYKNGSRKQLNDTKARIAEIELVLSGSGDDHVERIRRQWPQAVVSTSDGWLRYQLVPEVWGPIQAKLEIELQQLKEGLPALEQEVADAEQKTESLKNYLVEKAG